MQYGSDLKLGVPFLGVPIIRTIEFLGLHWGPLILGNYKMLLEEMIGGGRSLRAIRILPFCLVKFKHEHGNGIGAVNIRLPRAILCKIPTQRLIMHSLRQTRTRHGRRLFCWFSGSCKFWSVSRAVVQRKTRFHTKASCLP